MSTTLSKRTNSQAMRDAEAFRELFMSASERWMFAGSLRRKRPEVADIEHVVIPRFGDAPGTDLFATPERTNLLNARLDELVANGEMTKHIYGVTGYRWGERYRGVDFRGFNNEVFCATPDNWGPTLAIRTGPAEFSQRLVTGLLKQGRRNKDGQVWKCQPCTVCAPDRPRDHLCKGCQGTRLECVEPIPVPTEEMYFELCGIKYIEPERRA
jgi:DNA polymerase/3'-5' exonuclease PolX